MTRLLAASLALVALAAACASVPDGVLGDETASAPPPLAKQKPKRTKVLVTVVDGDTHRWLEGARVVIGRRSVVWSRGLGRRQLLHGDSRIWAIEPKS